MSRLAGRKVHYLYVLIDTIIVFSVFFSVYLWRNKSFAALGSNAYLVIFFLWVILIISSLKVKNLYVTDRSLTIPGEFLLVVNAILYPSVIIAALIFFLKFKFFSRTVFGLSFILLVTLISGWRICKRIVLRDFVSKGYNNFNALIVGAGRVGKLLKETIDNQPFLGLNIVGFVDDFKDSFQAEVSVLGKVSNFKSICKRYFVDEVFVTIPSERVVVSKIIEISKKMHVSVRVIPENFEEAITLMGVSHIGLMPVLTYKSLRHPPAEFVLKRLFDFFLSLALLILLSPLFVFISIVIKLNSAGPVFYVQKRMGKKGRIFKFYKFRSMVKEAESLKTGLMDKNESRGSPSSKRSSIIFKIRKDPRVTGVGRILRRYSFDELPQLFNVLFGDMSLVGPRPFPIEESNKFEHDHMPRLNMRPGITGLAQTKGRSKLRFYHWVKWDLWYVHNWSLGLDFFILWRTISVVLKAKGAY